MSDFSQVQRWTEVDPTYLTDHKKRPIEVLIFVNHCAYNPAAKVPVLRRRSGMHTFSALDKQGVEDVVVKFVTQPHVRLLAEGLSANDHRTLPREVRKPSQEVVDGTAKIYEEVA